MYSLMKSTLYVLSIGFLSDYCTYCLQIKKTIVLNIYMEGTVSQFFFIYVLVFIL